MQTDKPDFSHLVAAWDITKACNFHCIHCISGAGKRWRTYQIPTEQAKLIAWRIGELGITEISWSGGEPLLRMDLEEIMLHGLRYGIESYGAVSNGYLITRDRIQKLVDAGLTGIQISIDGIDKNQNAILRKGPKDCFSRAVRAIELCLEQGLSVVLGTMLYPEIVPTLDLMYELASRLGVDMLRFSAFVPNGRGDQDRIRKLLMLSPEQMKMFLCFLRRRYFQKPGFIGLDYAFALNPFMGCFHSTEGRNHFFIDYKGDVFPSTGMERDVFRIGNVVDEDLADILIRPQLTPPLPLRDDIVGICRRCDKFDECRGGPRGVSYMFSGRFDSSPTICLYHEYQERADFLGDPLWPRMLSSLTVEELRDLQALIRGLASEKHHQAPRH